MICNKLTLLFTLIFSTVVFAAPSVDKIVIVVFENASEEDVIKLATFKDIAQNSAYFNNFHAVARPSQPNYIALTAAHTYGITSDDKIDLDEKSIANLLDDKKYSWKVYAENYPENKGCFTDDKSDDGLYVRKHNPFISYTYINQDPNGRCKQIVNAQNHFKNDLTSNKLPHYSFYIPNLVNDGHSLMGITAAEEWLKEYFYPLMKQANKNTLFILTFDEGNKTPTDPKFAENKVYTAFYGPMVNQMIISERYDFYNLLRTIEELWQLGSLDRNDKTATPITSVIWKK